MSVKGETREELKGYLTYTKLMLKGGLSLSKTLITNAGDVLKLRQVRPLEEHFVRPARAYELPTYSPDMKVCRSREKYLRPTRLCNPWEPEVIALANHLGSFQKSDYEFAQAAFEFAKENMYLEIMPLDGVAESIRRGTGTCFQLISVFIALCRAAGIKARYKMYAMNMIQTFREVLIDSDPLAKRWYDALGYFTIEGEEAFVDGRLWCPWDLQNARQRQDRSPALAGMHWDVVSLDPVRSCVSKSVPPAGTYFRLLYKIAQLHGRIGIA
jgi:transglutaminase-like putative cysteine protease